MTGLSSREVEDRIQRGLDNVQVNSSTRTVKEIVKENVFTYFNLIFTVLGILLVIVGSFKDLSFMLIVLCKYGNKELPRKSDPSRLWTNLSCLKCLRVM